MSYLKCSQEKIRGVLGRIDFLLGRVFPYKSSEIALKMIRRVFEDYEKKLKNAENNSITEQLCHIVNNDVSRSLPVIELIANSSDVRSVFEFHEPFWELTSKIIKPSEIPSIADIHIIITSGWRYSPFVLREIPDVLKDFILISLPASEVHNPLLFPLAGHELGHVVWNISQHSDEDIRKIITIVKDILTASTEIVPRGQQISMLPNRKLAEQLNNALQHVSEFFCDCFGLRLFGEGFLYAFLYFFLPIPQRTRITFSTHPPTTARFALLKRACKAYSLPSDALASAGECTMSNNDSLITKVYNAIADEIIKLADKIVLCAGKKLGADPIGSVTEKDRILQSFQRLQPAVHAKTMADVINAGWFIYNDASAAKEITTDILFDLIAKSFEVMAIEKRIGSSGNA